MKCPYCGQEAKRVTGRAIYPHRTDLFMKNFWRCAPCFAYVGCHPGTAVPYGRMANAELRKWKQAAHAAFDPIWKSGKMMRKEAYSWLAKQLDMSEDNTHIGMFDIENCKRVIAAVKGFL